ncbi:MAG: DUF3256 family protein [Tannerellaceae bacterium]|nr:DUF3256 family protein [Tannerellaceae bacterium]
MKRYGILFLLCLSAGFTKAQDMKTLFINIPDDYLPQLETAWRKDLIDLYQSGKEARLKNTMEGTSRLLTLTEDYLLLQVTERSSIELKKLPLINNTHIICMISAIEAPATHSLVRFYTTEWQPLESSGLFTPVTADWFINEQSDINSEAYQDAIARLDIHLVKYSLSPDAQTLTAVYTTPRYLNEEERKKIRPFLKDHPKIYIWDKSYFR